MGGLNFLFTDVDIKCKKWYN